VKRSSLIVLALVPVVLAVAGCQLSRAGYASAPYSVLRADSPFQIREYPALQIVETRTGGDDFMRLFRYISRNNSDEAKIAMTTPVFMEGQGTTNGNRMAFVLPQSLVVPPQPKDSAVSVRTQAAGTFAVLRFRGSRQDSGGTAARELKGWMAEKGFPPQGEPVFAYFDPPWTPGFLRRNEVMIRTSVVAVPSPTAK